MISQTKYRLNIYAKIWANEFSRWFFKFIRFFLIFIWIFLVIEAKYYKKFLLKFF